MGDVREQALDDAIASCKHRIIEEQGAIAKCRAQGWLGHDLRTAERELAHRTAELARLEARKLGTTWQRGAAITLDDAKAEAVEIGVKATVEYPDYVLIVDALGRVIFTQPDAMHVWRAEVYVSASSWMLGDQPVEVDAVPSSDVRVLVATALVIANRVSTNGGK